VQHLSLLTAKALFTRIRLIARVATATLRTGNRIFLICFVIFPFVGERFCLMKLLLDESATVFANGRLHVSPRCQLGVTLSVTTQWPVRKKEEADASRPPRSSIRKSENRI
jgi:hypothetical protein